MDAERIKLLIREGEGLAVEFKEKYRAGVDEDIVAFANTKGGALLIGVRDDGTICGHALTNDLKAKINSVARNCNPSISVAVMRAADVVAIEVQEGTDKPYHCASGYFRRLNGTTQKMSRNELGAMFAENEPIPFEERTVKSFTFDDVSTSKIRAFVKEADIRIGRTASADFLRSLNVADEKRVKNAGILFFADDVYRHIHQAQMTCVAFKGTDRIHIYDRRDVRDDLLTQFDEAISFIMKHLNVRSEIRGVNRYDIYEIPLEVMREAVVNALMHRDYSITGTQVSIEVYSDRVEIINPGGLPRGLSREKLGTLSVRRNELVADLFYRMGKVERIGSGVRKMKQAMAGAGLQEPEFDTDGFFRAVFHRPELAVGTQEGGVQKGGQKGSQKSVQKILAVIAERPGITINELAGTVGIGASAIKKHLRNLKNKGLLRRIGPDKGGHWEVMK